MVQLGTCLTYTTASVAKFLWEYAYYVLATENFWTYTVISAAPSLQKIGPKYKNPSNFSDFSSVQPLANPHKIRFIQK